MAEKKNEASSDSGIISESVVSDFGRRRTPCRHCKSRSDIRITHALRAPSLTVYDCQALIDRGWIRDGYSLLKPEMETTCCPCYAIRLKASDFVPSKAQEEVFKQMQRFLDGSPNVNKPDEEMSNIYRTMKYLSDQIDSAVLTCTELGKFPSDVKFSKASVKSVAPAKRLQAEGTQDLLYTSKISFQIAADLTRANKSISTEKDPNFTAELLSSHLKNVASTIGLLVKACNGHVNFYSTETPAVSKDSSSTDSGELYVKKKNLEIRLKRSYFDQEAYALYRRYVIKRHNYKPDYVTESYYKRNYVDSSLIFVPSSGDNTVPPCGFGSFHQQYLIDGKLVAVVVIDILPKYLASKYLFWDPDLAFLSLGKYCILQGINWVKETQSYCPSLQYSNLGYYIHSLKNMKYKAEYCPSELLCPRRYQWVSFDIAKRLLDQKPYVVLSDFATLQYEARGSPNLIHDQIEQENAPFPDESDDIRIDPDEEISEIASEDPGDNSEPETTSLVPAETQNISNIIIGLKGMHLKDKFDIHQKINRLMEGLRKVTLVGRIYSCKDCKTHLALCDDIVSKEFHCNSGKAYLFTKVVNVTVGAKEDRMMMTSLHTVSDIFCIKCGINVGWTYETAHEENQKYMEGKSVLEQFKLSGPDQDDV